MGESSQYGLMIRYSNRVGLRFSLAGRLEVNRRDTGTFMGYVRDKPLVLSPSPEANNFIKSIRSSDGNFKLTTDMVQALTIVTPLPGIVTFNLDIAVRRCG